MSITQKATRLELLNFSTPQMRAFHMAWLSFLLCFFGWFGIAPLTPIIQKEFGLSDTQLANTMIASMALTLLGRMAIGFFSDRFGPRLTYTWLLILGSLPVMGMSLTHNYETFLCARLATGALGAAFVLTQYHTSLMFSSRCVGTANATAAGWGNMGGGLANMTMPLIFTVFTGLGLSGYWSWRLALFIPGILLLLCGIAYYYLTQDTPEGNCADLRARGRMSQAQGAKSSWSTVCYDYRVWALFIVYGACFGIEVIIHNSAAAYFGKRFSLSLPMAGLVAGLFGLLAIFARSLGGLCSDWVSRTWGLRGRTIFLAAILLCQGIAMLLFSSMNLLALAVGALMLFGLFVHMAAGATYAVVPFINKKAIGLVSGIVSAGGTAVAIAAGFLLKVDGLSYSDAIGYLGGAVMLTSCLAFSVTFSPQDEAAAEQDSAKPVGEPEQALVPAV